MLFQGHTVPLRDLSWEPTCVLSKVLITSSSPVPHWFLGHGLHHLCLCCLPDKLGIIKVRGHGWGSWQGGHRPDIRSLAPNWGLPAPLRLRVSDDRRGARAWGLLRCRPAVCGVFPLGRRTWRSCIIRWPWIFSVLIFLMWHWIFHTAWSCSWDTWWAAIKVRTTVLEINRRVHRLAPGFVFFSAESPCPAGLSVLSPVLQLYFNQKSLSMSCYFNFP